MLKNVKRSFSTQLISYHLWKSCFWRYFHGQSLSLIHLGFLFMSPRSHLMGQTPTGVFCKTPKIHGAFMCRKKTPSGTHQAPSCLCLPTFNFKVKDIGRVSISSTTTPEGARTLTEARQKGNGRRGGERSHFLGGAKPSEVEVNWGYNYLFMTDISWYIGFLEWFSTISRMIFHHFSDI